MSIDRITRVNEALRREIAEAVIRIMNDSDIDPSGVTVTRVSSARNLRSARVYVSVRESGRKQNAIFALLRRKSPEIQDRINKDFAFKYTPRLTFELDTSIETGHKVLELLSEIEEDSNRRAQTDNPENEE